MGVKVYHNNEWVEFSNSSSSSGVSTFLQLTDTPDSYVSSGSSIVAVKADLSGLEFVNANSSGIGVDNYVNSASFSSLSEGGVKLTLGRTGNLGDVTADLTFGTLGIGFTDLSDTPSSYIDPNGLSNANKFVKVNSTGTGLEFNTQTPTTGAAGVDTQVQYNDGSTLQGAKGLLYIKGDESDGDPSNKLILKPNYTNFPVPANDERAKYGLSVIKAQSNDTSSTSNTPWNSAGITADGGLELMRTRVESPLGGPYIDLKGRSVDKDARIQMDYGLQYQYDQNNDPIAGTEFINPSSGDYSSITFQTGGTSYYNWQDAPSGRVTEKIRIGKNGEIGILAGGQIPNPNPGPYNNIQPGTSEIINGVSTPSNNPIVESTSSNRSEAEKYGTNGQVLMSAGYGKPVFWGTNGAGNSLWTQNSAGIYRDTDVMIRRLDNANSASLAVHGSILSGTVGSFKNVLDLRSQTANSDCLTFRSMRITEDATGAGNPDWYSAAWRIQRRVDVTDLTYIQFGGGDDDNNPNDDEDLIFGTSGGERLRINTAGKVGVGTNNPSHLMHVYGGEVHVDVAAPNDSGLGSPFVGTRYNNDTDGANLFLQHSRGSTLENNVKLIAGDEVGAVQFRSWTYDDVNNIDGDIHGAGFIKVLASETSNSIDGVPADMIFGTGTASDNADEKVRITSAGNVGIGTSVPNDPVSSSNNAKLAVGVVTCHELYVNGNQITSSGGGGGGGATGAIVSTQRSGDFDVTQTSYQDVMSVTIDPVQSGSKILITAGGGAEGFYVTDPNSNDNGKTAATDIQVFRDTSALGQITRVGQSDNNGGELHMTNGVLSKIVDTYNHQGNPVTYYVKAKMSRILSSGTPTFAGKVKKGFSLCAQELVSGGSGGSSSSSEYSVLDYGVVADGITDNTAAYSSLISTAPEGSTITWPPGTYRGHFLSSKSFNLVGGPNVILKPISNNSSNSNAILQFTGTEDSAVTLNAQPVFGSDQISHSNSFLVVGDIVRLWDGYGRPSDNQEVNNELVKVREATNSGVTKIHGTILSNQNNGTYTYVKLNTLKNIKIQNFRFDLENSLSHGILCNICENVENINIHVTGGRGKSIFMKNVYNCYTSDTSRTNATDVTSGYGYHYQNYIVKYSRVEHTRGHLTRHVIDNDSTYMLTVKGAYATQSGGTPFLITHNSFGGFQHWENLNIENTGGVRGIAASADGLGQNTAAKRASEILRNITIKDYYDRSNTDSTNPETTSIYIQYQCKNFVLKDIVIIEDGVLSGNAADADIGQKAIRFSGPIGGSSSIQNVHVEGRPIVMMFDSDAQSGNHTYAQDFPRNGETLRIRNITCRTNIKKIFYFKSPANGSTGSYYMYFDIGDVHAMVGSSAFGTNGANWHSYVHIPSATTNGQGKFELDQIPEGMGTGANKVVVNGGGFLLYFHSLKNSRNASLTLTNNTLFQSDMISAGSPAGRYLQPGTISVMEKPCGYGQVARFQCGGTVTFDVSAINGSANNGTLNTSNNQNYVAAAGDFVSIVSINAIDWTIWKDGTWAS